MGAHHMPPRARFSEGWEEVMTPYLLPLISAVTIQPAAVESHRAPSASFKRSVIKSEEEPPLLWSDPVTEPTSNRSYSEIYFFTFIYFFFGSLSQNWKKGIF